MHPTLLAAKLHPLWRIRAERFMDLTLGYRLRTLRNSPRVTSAFLHRQALECVGANTDGEGAVLFDVGAHAGETCLALALELPQARIHAFEPIGRIYEKLAQHCRSQPNVVCHKLALGRAPEERWIELLSVDPSCTMNQVSRLASDGTPAGWKEKIRISSVDEIAKELSVDQLALLKIDVEGFELQVLRGAERMLLEHRIASVMAEVTFARDSSQHVHLDSVRQILEPAGYALVGIYDPAYRHETGDLYYANALFRPVANGR